MTCRNDANGNDDEDGENDSDYDNGGDWDQGNDTGDPPGFDDAAATVSGTSDRPLTYDERQHLASFMSACNSGNVSLSHAHTTTEHGQVPFEMQLLTTSANTYETLQT
ncbi:unnamed protein product [Peronospora destructor]|uniref:Uncharacterized protein n=1 Tax=Peronospora destructor TaxID=86335 RepID=A0AAV0SUN0_9STRA|nr:unnamed protein product [Peronospora destructor]